MLKLATLPKGFFLLTIGLFLFVNTTHVAQVPVVVTADQPNVWTLEQAHYLIAQLHRRNLSLRAQPLSNLDPNAINAASLDALKSILTISAEFDQSVSLNNKEVQRSRVENSSERAALIQRRDNLEQQSLELVRQIAELRIKEKRATSDEERAEIQNEIEQREIVSAAVDKQLELTNSRISSVSTSSGDIKLAEAQDATPAPSPEFSNIFTETAKSIIQGFNNSPKLNASLQLDNYVQMQYEILSKQLTLLRSEVGAGERLLFLEIPQSVRTSQGTADNLWVQSWWRIVGYRQCVAFLRNRKNGEKVVKDSVPCSFVFDRAPDNRRQISINQLKEAMVRSEDSQNREHQLRQLLTLDDLEDLTPVADLQTRLGGIGVSLSPTGINTDLAAARQSLYDCWDRHGRTNYDSCKDQSNRVKTLEDDFKTQMTRGLNEFITGKTPISATFLREHSSRLATIAERIPMDTPEFRRMVVSELFKIPLPSSSIQYRNDLEEQDRSLRVVDLFPRQSSLNVNDMKIRSRATSLKGIFSLLSGFGANAGFQRTREKYSQFIQQELYSSAFGKGSREFGWTFNPMPGTDRVSSGVRTTYAILVIPEDTTSLILESSGCYFNRKGQQPIDFLDTQTWTTKNRKRGCSKKAEFNIMVPDGGSLYSNEFFVTGINYRSVSAGERVVVTVNGRDFSSQMGVLINGVPLMPALGLAQPFIIDDRKQPGTPDGTPPTATAVPSTQANSQQEEPVGEFERIGTGQIVMSFRLKPDFVGIPTITLVSPRKSVDLNSLPGLRINGQFKRLDDSNFLFGNTPPTNKPTIRVDSITAFDKAGRLHLLLTGNNLTQIEKIYLDSTEIDRGNGGSGHLLSLPTPIKVASSVSSYSIVLLTNEGAIGPRAIPNPTYKPPRENQNR